MPTSVRRWLSCAGPMAARLAVVLGVAAGAVSAAEPVGPRLPEKLRGLLQQEMMAIRDASHEILDALVMGQDGVVAARAQDIHESFIMQRNLTDDDRQILRRTLPEALVVLDRSFHQAATRLAAAARRGDGPAQRARFAELTDTCAVCHRQFATNRFPGFTTD